MASGGCTLCYRKARSSKRDRDTSGNRWELGAAAFSGLTFGAMTATFSGWPAAYQEFFIGLEMDNSKSYFDAHRKQYLEKVKGPMEALIAALEPEFGPGKIARPNRDIRFSADKSPYKTNIYANVGTGARGGHVALGSKGLMSAAGRYELDPSLIPKFRDAVAADGSGRQLAKIVEKLEKDGYEVGGEELKRVPSGYPPDHPRARLLRHKRVFMWKNLGLHKWLGSGAAAEHVAKVWRDAQPLNDWFAKHVGSAEPGLGSDRGRGRGSR